MSRKKKFVRNMIVIIVGMVIFYYIGGLHFTKKSSIEDTIRELYGTETVEIMEFNLEGVTKTLMFDPNNKTVSIVGTKRFLGFYQTASSHIGYELDQQHSFDQIGMYDSESGMVMFIYQNNPKISSIEIYFDNGEKMTLNEWKSDFVGYMLEVEEWQNGTYKAYDQSGNLIEERQY